MGSFARGRAALTLMADCAAKLFERMLVMIGMIAERLRKSGVTRIFGSDVASHAAINTT